MIIVGVDPGVNGCGIAVVEGGVLLSAFYSKGDIREVTMHLDGFLPKEVANVVIELPHGARDHTQAKKMDLIRLSAAAGFFAGRVPKNIRYAAYLVPVDVWSRGVPYDVREARLHLAPPLGLKPEEFGSITPVAKTYVHNIIDAVCIARWADAQGTRLAGHSVV